MGKNRFIVMILIILFLSIFLFKSQLNIKNNYTSIIVNSNKEKIVFAGDSITDYYDLNKYFKYDNKIIINSGISGYQTSNILKRYNNVIKQYNADKIFLMIGTNDLGAGLDREDIINNIKKILSDCKRDNKNVKLYYETIYPVNRSLRKSNDKRYNSDIIYINSEMKKYCNANGIKYLDIYSILEDEKGSLKNEFTSDGLHLNDEGYKVISSFLRQYVEE